MNPKRVIIIDDEHDARRVIAKYLERYFPDFEIAGEGTSVESGIRLLDEIDVDLVFMDINLGDGTGFDVLDNASIGNAALIFTTAFDQYAVKAFKYHALNYLLKPIEPQDFLDAVNLSLNSRPVSEKSSDDLQRWMLTYGQNERKLAVPTSDGTRFVQLDQIVYFEADSSYCSVCLTDRKQIVVSKPLKYFSDKLENNKMFMRPHKSYIVNISCIEEYIKEDGGTLKLTTGKSIPISRQKKDEILKEMNDFFI